MSVSTHRYSAVLTGHPDGPMQLPVSGGRITLDDRSAPHVAGTLTLPLPMSASTDAFDNPAEPGFDQMPFGEGTFGSVLTLPKWSLDAAALSRIDPRKTLRVRITVDVTADTYTHRRVFDLGLRDRTVNHSDGTLTLGLASDEALLSDYAPLSDDTGPLERRSSLRGIVSYVLEKAVGRRVTTWGTSADYSFSWTDFDAEALTWKAGQSALEYIVPLVQTAGLRIVCDELRGWTLRDASYAAGGTLEVQHGENIVAADENISRADESWFDAAVTRYTWTDRDGNEQTRVDSFALRNGYTRLVTIERDTPYPGAGFSSYVVRRAQARGREVSTTTVADWRAHAEMPITVRLQGAPILTGLTARVEFDLDRDEMSVTTRTIQTPATAWQFLPAGQRWANSDPGESWIGEEA